MHPNGQSRVCENAVILLNELRFYFLSAKILEKLKKRDENPKMSKMKILIFGRENSEICSNLKIMQSKL